jgi:hypothetical protein
MTILKIPAISGMFVSEDCLGFFEVLLERFHSRCSVLVPCPRSPWACFPENTVTWPRKRGHDARYTYREYALGDIRRNLYEIADYFGT